MSVDQDRLREAVASILLAVGENPHRPGLVGTPERVARMYEELFSGLGKDPAAVLATGFEEGHEEAVIAKDVPFFSVCEHHLLPFYGSAHIGYLPKGSVVGVSKLARVLDILARRPQLQERLTDQVADTINTVLRPGGVMVVLEAQHLCMNIRGVKKSGSTIVTMATRGLFKEESAARAEFLALLRGG